MKLLFIGAGKMATALAGGIASHGLFPAEDITACDPSPEAAAAFNNIEAAAGLSGGVMLVSTKEHKKTSMTFFADDGHLSGT